MGVSIRVSFNLFQSVTSTVKCEFYLPNSFTVKSKTMNIEDLEIRGTLRLSVNPAWRYHLPHNNAYLLALCKFIGCLGVLQTQETKAAFGALASLRPLLSIKNLLCAIPIGKGPLSVPLLKSKSPFPVSSKSPSPRAPTPCMALAKHVLPANKGHASKSRDSPRDGLISGLG